MWKYLSDIFAWIYRISLKLRSLAVSTEALAQWFNLARQELIPNHLMEEGISRQVTEPNQKMHLLVRVATHYSRIAAEDA